MSNESSAYSMKAYFSEKDYFTCNLGTPFGLCLVVSCSLNIKIKGTFKSWNTTLFFDKSILILQPGLLTSKLIIYTS